eukprot:8490988-Pyramimonas_sp.AAC.1
MRLRSFWDHPDDYPLDFCQNLLDILGKLDKNDLPPDLILGQCCLDGLFTVAARGGEEFECLSELVVEVADKVLIKEGRVRWQKWQRWAKEA